MTWLDVLFAAAVLLGLWVGWAKGSVWLLSGMASGFLGAWAAETYASDVAARMGGFQGSAAIAGILLFMGVAGAVLLAGFFARKIFSVPVLSFFDKCAGLVAGLAVSIIVATGAVAVSLSLKPEWASTDFFAGSFLISKAAERFQWLSHPPRAADVLESAKSRMLKKKSAFEPVKERLRL